LPDLDRAVSSPRATDFTHALPARLRQVSSRSTSSHPGACSPKPSSPLQPHSNPIASPSQRLPSSRCIESAPTHQQSCCLFTLRRFRYSPKT
jgi:hypothetical protein